MIGDMTGFADYLAQVQSARRTELACAFPQALSARLNDAAIRQALLTGLPMAQGVECRIRRSRGRGAVLTGKVRYREGLRMLAAARGEPIPLTARETAALQAAESIAADVLRLDSEEARFRHICDWLCQNVRYAHTAPGAKGYELLVGASGAILRGEANCQGFADALFLLCGLCGMEAVYRCGPGEKRLHVWNEVRIDGNWRIADASRAARGLSD